MKRYYGFMFFSTVCFLFKSIKCVIQKIGKLKKLLEIFQTRQKLTDILRNPKIARNFCQCMKLGFGQISNLKNQSKHSCLNFDICAPGNKSAWHTKNQMKPLKAKTKNTGKVTTINAFTFTSDLKGDGCQSNLYVMLRQLF